MNLRKAVIFSFGLCAISFILVIVNVDACKDSDAIGRIVALKGLIIVNESETHLNAPLCLGDVIQTGPGSRADIKLLGSSTVFRVEQQAELRLLGALIDRASLIDAFNQLSYL